MNNCFVYVLYYNASIKYIGVSIDPHSRFKNHIYSAFNKIGKEYNLKKSRWIRKYKDSIKMKIIFNGTEEDCYRKEIQLIGLAKYKGFDLMNLTSGGDRAPKISEHNSPELTKQKISAKALGRKVSDETKIKMSISHRGKMTYLKYNKFGIENPRAFSIMQLTLLGEPIKFWPYAQLAINELGLNRTAITDCLKGRQKTAGGFRWVNCSNHGFPKSNHEYVLNAG